MSIAIEIERAFVNDLQVDFEYTDAVADLTLGANTTIAHHQTYKSRYLNALREADEGELSVKIPADCIKQLSEAVQPTAAAAAEPTEPSTSSTLIPDQGQEAVFAPITIRVEYTLEDPRHGIVFVQKDEEIAPYRSNHVYTVNQPLPGATRSWLPCIDTIADRCTWDMEFIVPRKVDGGIIQEYDGEGSFDENDGILVVCSGEVLEQVISPIDPSKKIVHYRLSEPVSAPFIGFAIGPFKMIKLSPIQLQEEVMNAAELDENQQSSLMAEINMMSNIYAFCLPGLEEELSITCSFLMHAMHFYTQEYGSYPFSDYKLVFVEDAWSDTTSNASLSICSSKLLHPDDIIDQIYNTRRELSQALARQWFGIYIVQKSWSDSWLVRGIAQYMSSLFIKRHLGNNEYRLRLKKDMELCCKLDVNRPPVYDQALPHPLDLEDLSFIDLKAPIVIYMLDKRMCKGGGTLGLSRVLPKILVSAMSGELAQNAISTHYFLRLCRKVSGFDTKVFAEQWVYKSGCPKFTFKFHFNRKKMVVEIHMSQENTNGDLIDEGLVSPLFTGNLTVRIHEADGTPYEHILDIQSQQNKFEVQFNTKYKRIRRNTKRFLAKQAAAAAAVAEEEQQAENDENNNDPNMVLGIIPSLGLGMPIFEDLNQKKDWKIIEWGQDEEDTSGAASAMFDWIRLDAEFEWLCICEFKQPDYMWAAQLTKDRDVVAQHEAIDALKHMPSLATSTSFLRAVLDPKCFYKIRMEATYGLASCANTDLNWVGLHQLNKMFQKRYCFPMNNTIQDGDLPITHSIPKPNNFSSLPDYFIQKASVVAFSQIRDDHGLVPVKIRQFLLDLLKYNDNIGNEFSDCYYVSIIISSLGDSLIPAQDGVVDYVEAEAVNNAAKAEIERFRTLDYVIPTYHNIITVTCLKTMTKLMLKGLLPVNIPMFLQYTRYGNYLDIRITSFDSLFILCGLSDTNLNQYLLNVIKQDPSVYVSHYIAKSLLSWLGLALKSDISSTINTAKYIEEFAEEDGRVNIDDDHLLAAKTPQQEFNSTIENLRKRFESDLTLQQNLWNLLNSTEQNAKIDHSIKKYLLQFCEFLFKPIVDSALKVKIRVPTTPVTASAQGIEESDSPIIRIKPKHKKTNSIHIKTESLTQPDTLPVSSSTAADSLMAIDNDSNNAVLDHNITDEEPIATQRNILSTTTATAPSTEVVPPIVIKPSVPLQPVESLPTPALPPPPHPPKPKQKKVDSVTAEELKKCRKIMNKIIKQKSSLPFNLPVDEKLDGAAGYYEVIKHPMDLSKIKKKIENKEYSAFQQFEDDIRLMLSNCFVFNSPGTFVYNEGQALEAAFDRELAALNGNKQEEELQNMTIVETPVSSPQPPSFVMKIPELPTPFSSSPAVTTPVATTTTSVHQPQERLVERKKSVTPLLETEPRMMSEREKMKKILEATMTSSHAFEFLRAVDPIKQGIPHYVDVIKRPMDLGQIKRKFRNDEYANPQAMDNDMQLMFNNCYIFNPPNTYVYNQSKSLQKEYEAEWAKYFGTKNTLKEKTSLEAPLPQQSISQHAVKLKSAAVTTPAAVAPVLPASATGPSAAITSTKSHKQSKVQHIPESSTKVSSSTAVVERQNSAPFNPAINDEINKKKCERVLKKLWGLQESAPFRTPVDAVALGIPHYYEVIRRPMDLSLVQRKFTNNEYNTIWDLEKDIRQIFWNCVGFNSHDSWVVKQSQAMEKFFNQVWSAEFAMPNAIKGEDKRIASKVVNKLSLHDHAPLFNEPVDTEVLLDYARTVKQPMDLRTIWEKLESSKYTSLKAVDHDIRLVFKNCYTYNVGNPVIKGEGQKLEKYYNAISKEMRTRINDTAGTGSVLTSSSSTTTSTKKRRPSSSPAPVKVSTSLSASAETEPPTKMLKLSGPSHTSTRKDHLQKPRKPIVKLEVNAMDIDPVVTISQPAVDKPPSVSSKPPIAEIRLSTTASSKPSSHETPQRIHPDIQSRLNTFLQKMVKHPLSVGFTEPVDPVALGIPHYPMIVKKPMDFSTMATNLKNGQYKSVREFESDMRLIFTNCYTFNGFDHVLSQNAKILEGILNKEAPILRKKEEQLRADGPVNKSSSSGSNSGSGSVTNLSKEISPAKAELRKYKSVLDKLQTHQCYYAFGVPVDPVLLQIPTYFDIIKRPMDFGTIRHKLEANKYTSADQLLRDAKQVFINCYLFNIPDDIVSQMGRDLQAEFNRLATARGLQTIQIDMENEV